VVLGPKSRRATAAKTTRLAVYTALASLPPLGFIVWRRNLVAL
jgi:hypothetical protein